MSRKPKIVQSLCLMLQSVQIYGVILYNNLIPPDSLIVFFIRQTLTGLLWQFCECEAWAVIPFHDLSPYLFTIFWCDFKACGLQQDSVPSDTYLLWRDGMVYNGCAEQKESRTWAADSSNPWNISEGKCGTVIITRDAGLTFFNDRVMAPSSINARMCMEEVLIPLQFNSH